MTLKGDFVLQSETVLNVGHNGDMVNRRRVNWKGGGSSFCRVGQGKVQWIVFLGLPNRSRNYQGIYLGGQLLIETIENSRII